MHIFICFYLSLDRTLHGISANRTKGDTLWTTSAANKIIGLFAIAGSVVKNSAQTNGRFCVQEIDINMQTRVI